MALDGFGEERVARETATELYGRTASKGAHSLDLSERGLSFKLI